MVRLVTTASIALLAALAVAAILWGSVDVSARVGKALMLVAFSQETK